MTDRSQFDKADVKTPRTDAHIVKHAALSIGLFSNETIDLARQLEREMAEHKVHWQADVNELAAARRVADELRRELATKTTFLDSAQRLLAEANDTASKMMIRAEVAERAARPSQRAPEDWAASIPDEHRWKCPTCDTYMIFMHAKDDPAPVSSTAASICPACKGAGTVKAMTQQHGPDDYEFDAECYTCKGTGALSAREGSDMVLVPREPTPTMIAAGGAVLGPSRFQRAWEAALEAAGKEFK